MNTKLERTKYNITHYKLNVEGEIIQVMYVSGALKEDSLIR